MVSNFSILFNPFSTGKIKNVISEKSLITQNLNFNNLGTTNAEYIYLHIIRKPIEYSLKIFLANPILTVFDILLSKSRSVL